MSLLDETHNFVTLYTYAAAHRESWRAYNKWMAYNLLAAVAGPRCTITTMRDSPIHANIYTILLGPSTAGKNVAIDFAGKVLRRAVEKLLPTLAHMPRKPALLPHFGGRITEEGLWKRITLEHRLAERADAPDYLRGLPPHFWLISQELRQVINAENPNSEQLLSTFTGIYTRSEFTTGNVTKRSGSHEVDTPVITWIGGTTLEWMMKAIPLSMVEGGFLGRLLFVPGRIPPLRFDAPPPDYEAVVDYLGARLAELFTIRGDFTFADPVVEALYRSYRITYARDRRTEEPMIQNALGREHVTLLKLAILHALAREADVEGALTLQEGDLEAADELVRTARSNIKHIIHHLSESSRDGALMAKLVDIVRGSPKGVIFEDVFNARATQLGIARDQRRRLVETLTEAKGPLRRRYIAGVKRWVIGVASARRLVKETRVEDNGQQPPEPPLPWESVDGRDPGGEEGTD